MKERLSRGLKESKMEYMTIKELAEIYGLNRETIRRIMKKLYPNQIKNGVKTLLTRDMVAKIIEHIHPTAERASKVKPTKNLEVEPTRNLEVEPKKFPGIEKFNELMQTMIDAQKQIADMQKQMIDIQKQMIDTQKQILERLDRLENKANNTKSLTYTPTHDEYEYYYISTIAKKLEVKNKDVFYALFQMNKVKRSQYTGKYEPSEQALDAGDIIIKAGAIMANRKLLPGLRNIFDNWKRNSTRLF